MAISKHIVSNKQADKYTPHDNMYFNSWAEKCVVVLSVGDVQKHVLVTPAKSLQLLRDVPTGIHGRVNRCVKSSVNELLKITPFGRVYRLLR